MNTWLWPDRTIGKRESRELREQHNALVNTCAAMLDTLVSIENEMNHWENTDDPIPQEARRMIADQATEAIRKATG